MPQLAKGGKWVFGWCIVGPDGEMRIPPEAYSEYGFQQGEQLIITRGSRSSGGFGIGRQQKLAFSPLRPRFLGLVVMKAERQVVLPSETNVQPGDRLLAVRGSGLALGFLQKGPIFEEAQQHPEIETFLIV
jgi:hypothetical protein